MVPIIDDDDDDSGYDDDLDFFKYNFWYADNSVPL
jgi:hypothetical protein